MRQYEVKEEGMLKKLDKLEEALNKGAIFITAAAFVVIVALISLNVVSRYIFLKSFNWAEEVAYLCFNWVVFLGVTIVYRYQGLTAIDLVVNRLHGPVKKAVLVLGYLLVVLTNLGLIVWGTKFSIQAWARKSPSLLIPYFFYDISIPVAGVLLFVYSLRFMIKAVRGEDVEGAALEDRV